MLMFNEVKLNDNVTANVLETNDYAVIRKQPIDCFYELFKRLNPLNKEKYYFIVFDLVIPVSNNGLFPVEKFYKFVKKAKTQNKQIIFIFEMIYEAPSYRYDLKKYFDILINKFDIPHENIIIWSGAQNQFGDDVNFITETFTCCSQEQLNENYRNLPTHHFVSLARLPRPHRQIATQEIWDKNLDRYGFCSIGASKRQHHIKLELIKPEYIHRIPTILDGYADDFASQRDWKDSRIHGAFLHLVHESSFDRKFQTNFWNTVFFTEKTIKPFALGQVPIFVTVAGHVKSLRKHGFDMFDDLIDHEYDAEDDGMIRIQKAVEQLENLCNRDINWLRNFKQQNMHRFDNNYRLVKKIISLDSNFDVSNQLNSILDKE